jgi:hypothetical protein
MSMGPLVFCTWVTGDSSVSTARSFTGSPYSLTRNARRYGAVFSRNVTRLEMPTICTPASYAPAKYVMPMSDE